MPFKNPGDLHVNRNLTRVMVAYAQQTQDFVASRVFPNIPSDSPSDFFNKMGRRSFLQSKMQKRAPRTQTPGVDWTFTRDAFLCEVWGLHHDVDDQDRSTADANWNLDRTGTELITQQALLRREKEWLDAFFKSGIWASDLNGGGATPDFTPFDDAGSSPIEFFRERRRAFHRRTGVRPNTVVFGPNVWDTISDHSEFVERIKYTQNAIGLSRALVGQAIEIPNVYVAEAVEAVDQSAELEADFAPETQYLAGDDFLLTYSAPRANREAPSAGYTFSWNGHLGASAWGGRVKKFRMEAESADRVEIEMAYDMKQVAPELGEFVSNAVTPGV